MDFPDCFATLAMTRGAHRCNSVFDHFRDLTKMIEIGSGKREVSDER
jgi:hypothetical protein